MTQLAHPLTRRPRTLVAAAVLIGVLVVAAAVALVARRRPGRAADARRCAAPVRPGHRRVASDARGRRSGADHGRPAVCGVQRARSRPPGGLPRRRLCAGVNTDYTPALHTVAQLVEQQGPMLAAAFADPGLKTLKVVTYGPSSAGGHVVRTRCSRCAAAGPVSPARAWHMRPRRPSRLPATTRRTSAEQRPRGLHPHPHRGRRQIGEGELLQLHDLDAGRVGPARGSASARASSGPGRAARHGRRTPAW